MGEYNYRYFIAYTFLENGQVRFGNCESAFKYKITSSRDLASVVTDLEEKYGVS